MFKEKKTKQMMFYLDDDDDGGGDAVGEMKNATKYSTGLVWMAPFVAELARRY